MDFGTMRKRLVTIIGVGAAIVVAAPGMVLAQAAKMGGDRATSSQCQAG